MAKLRINNDSCHTKDSSEIAGEIFEKIFPAGAIIGASDVY